MPSSPAVPKVRLGPRFAAANDVDRDVEEALGLEPEPEAELEAEKGVDEEIDELLSETEEQEQGQGSGNGQSSAGPKDNGEWGCRWEGCWRSQENQDDLVEHLQIGMPRVRGQRYANQQNISVKDENPTCVSGSTARGKDKSKQLDIHSSPTVELIREKDPIHVQNLVSPSFGSWSFNTHKGPSSYTDCRKTFTRSDALTKHLRSLHNITPDLPPRKKVKDSATNNGFPPGSSPPTSPYLMTKRSDREKDVDEVIAEVLPLSPPTTPASSSTAAPPTKPATKAKPRRSRAKTQKDKPVAQASFQPETRLLNFALPLATTSSFYNPGMADLGTDEDLSSVLPRLFDRQTFWQGSDDDEPALNLVRDVRARERQGPPYGVEEEEYDSLDEMIPPVSNVRVVGETGHPDGSDTVVPVMSRSKYHARFMMAKAKVMLLAEENEMRRKELESTMREEIELDYQLSTRNRHSTK
jgi:hypothetical protein